MCVCSVALTNLGKYNEGILDYVWLNLPATKEEIEEAFDKASISYGKNKHYSKYGDIYEEYFLSDWESEEGFDLEVGEYTNLKSLNETCQNIEDLDQWEKETLKAILEAGMYKDIDDAIEHIDSVVFYEGDPEKILDEMIDEELSCITAGNKVPEFLTMYFDYESCKRDLMFDFVEVSNGIISRY